MKKLLYSAMLLASVSLIASCNDDHEFLGPKEEIGGTALQSMAGEWYVSCDQVDEAGNVVYEDIFGVGRFQIATFNTADNNTTELFVTDNGNFWDFQCKAKVDIASLTFSANDAEDIINGCEVTIKEGKIMPGAGHQNNGSVADSICFMVKFSDDEYGPELGYAYHRFSGVRYSGLVEND